MQADKNTFLAEGVSRRRLKVKADVLWRVCRLQDKVISRKSGERFYSRAFQAFRALRAFHQYLGPFIRMYVISARLIGGLSL